MPNLSRWGRSWTDEEDQQIRELSRKNVLDEAIAEQLGRSKGSIGSRRRRLRIAKPGRRPWSNADLKALYDESLPNVVVAEMTGRNNATISTWRRKLGIKSVFKRLWTDEEEETMLRLYPTGGCYAVNKATGWSHKSIMNKAQSLKITRRSL